MIRKLYWTAGLALLAVMLWLRPGLAGAAASMAWAALWAVLGFLTWWMWLVAVAAALAWYRLVWRRRDRHPSLERVQHLFRSSSSVTASRWGEDTRRKRGMASPIDVLRRGSFLAVRRKMRHTRPSTRGLTWLALLRVPSLAAGVPLCRAGLLRVWASIEDVICIFGGPRTGKTQWLAGKIIDAVGAIVVTTTRVDLFHLTHRLRAKRGPVFVFNAGGLGAIESSVTFDPLTGCSDPSVPPQVAADMIPSQSGEAEQWAAQARRVLAALMHAAALGGLSMQDVLRWVANPKSDGVETEIVRLLRRSVSPGYEETARQFIGTNDRTQTSITASMMPALEWLNSPTARVAAGMDDAFDRFGAIRAPQLEVERFVRSNGTIYLLGRDDAQVAPLVAALTGHIAREGRRLAVLNPGGRLDPPLSFGLDEAAQTCPIPLDQWTADFGGFGMQLLCAFQSKSQLTRRWGADGGRVILNNAGAVMVFGGTKDTGDLKDWADLFGSRDEVVETKDERGRVKSTSTRQVPVISVAQLASLPEGSVAVLRRGMPPVIGKAPMAYARRDVRRDGRALPTVTAPAEVPVADEEAVNA